MFEERTVMIGGKAVSILIAQNDEGNSRPPCFIVGLSSHYHDKFSKEFQSFYQLILLDLYWTDPQFPDTYIQSLDLQSLVDHIESVRLQLLQQLGRKYEKIFLLAHSAYSFISINYAIKYEANVHGVINVGSPLIFDETKLQIWQEQYLNSNFAHPHLGGPTSRWYAYYQNRKNFLKKPPENTKSYFIDWYLSLGPLLWKNPACWNNKKDVAAKLWLAWGINVINTQTRHITEQQRDINMPMLSHFINLITDKDCYNELSKLAVPVLWVIGLYDSRVSLYQFEDYKKSNSLSSNIQLCYVDGAHWPMFSGDVNPKEFDENTIHWGQSILLDDEVKSCYTVLR